MKFHRVGIAAGYGLEGLGIESRWRRDIPHPSKPVVGPTLASYIMGTGSFLEVKGLGRGVNHPPQYRAEVKERIELYPLPLSRPSLPVLGRILAFMMITVGSWSKVCTLFWSSDRRFSFGIQLHLRRPIWLLLDRVSQIYFILEQQFTCFAQSLHPPSWF